MFLGEEAMFSVGKQIVTIGGIFIIVSLLLVCEVDNALHIIARKKVSLQRCKN